jgi:hypothetical protein
MPRSRAPKSSLLLVAVVAGALVAAPPAGAQPRRTAARPAAPKPFLDVRDAQRRAVRRRGDVSLRAPGAGTRAARGRLRSAGAVLDVDALTGTPRLLAGRGAPLSAPSRGDRREVAERFLRRHLAALGLSRTDLGSLQLARRAAVPGGAELLGYRQYASGEAASLVAFGEGTSARLGWQLDLRAGPAAHYAAVVDAASGRILYRANRVKSAANDALAGAASRPRTSAAKRAISGRRSVALPANTSPRISTPPP